MLTSNIHEASAGPAAIAVTCATTPGCEGSSLNAASRELVSEAEDRPEPTALQVWRESVRGQYIRAGPVMVGALTLEPAPLDVFGQARRRHAMLRAAAAAVPAASFALKMVVMAADIFRQLEDENSGPFADEYTIDAHRHRRGLRVYRPPGSSVGTQRGILPEDLKGGAQARPSSPSANVPVREPQSYEDCLRRLRVGEVGAPLMCPHLLPKANTVIGAPYRAK